MKILFLISYIIYLTGCYTNTDAYEENAISQLEQLNRNIGCLSATLYLKKQQKIDESTAKSMIIFCKGPTNEN